MNNLEEKNINKSNLRYMERVFLKEKNVDYFETDELTKEFSDRIIMFIENKMQSLSPINVSWDEFEKLGLMDKNRGMKTKDILV